jgi:hypothetical protein
VVAVEDDALVVYTPSVSPASADRVIEMIAGPALGPLLSMASKLRDEHIQHSRYMKMLRFKLANPQKREYRAERWCFRGSIDDWIDLPGCGSLAELVEKYAKHLNRESFYDLM